MSGLFDGTPLERPVTCDDCGQALAECRCPRGADGHVVLPKDQKVRVSRQRISSGRIVTTISGLVMADADKAALLKRLKALLGTGGTIQDGCLELQGDHRDKLVDLLRQEGYPAKPSGG